MGRWSPSGVEYYRGSSLGGLGNAVDTFLNIRRQKKLDQERTAQQGIENTRAQNRQDLEFGDEGYYNAGPDAAPRIPTQPMNVGGRSLNLPTEDYQPIQRIGAYTKLGPNREERQQSYAEKVFGRQQAVAATEQARADLAERQRRAGIDAVVAGGDPKGLLRYSKDPAADYSKLTPPARNEDPNTQAVIDRQTDAAIRLAREKAKLVPPKGAAGSKQLGTKDAVGLGNLMDTIEQHHELYRLYRDAQQSGESITGPLQQYINKAQDVTGLSSPESLLIRQKLNTVRQKALHSLYGSRLTKAEIEQGGKSIAGDEVPAAKAMANIAGSHAGFVSNLGAQIQALEDAGYDMSKFRQRYEALPGLDDEAGQVIPKPGKASTIAPRGAMPRGVPKPAPADDGDADADESGGPADTDRGVQSPEELEAYAAIDAGKNAAAVRARFKQLHHRDLP